IDGNILAEYWRRLYVGMTRAEDELYVTGALTPGADAEKQLAGTWYEAIEMALRPHAESRSDEEGREIALIYPLERVAPAPLAGRDQTPASGLTPLELPPVPEPERPLIVSPSSVHRGAVPLSPFDSMAEQVRDADTARREGIALHALLQHLGRVDPARRADVARKALAALLPDAPASHERLHGKAMSIFARPELGAIFGADSRAEVPFLLDARQEGKDIRLAGRMDRLVIDDSGVTVIDYKSDMSVPAAAAGVPENYIAQLSLYAWVAGQLFPERPVRAAILWTELESLMFLPPDLLAAARRGFTLR